MCIQAAQPQPQPQLQQEWATREPVRRQGEVRDREGHRGGRGYDTKHFMREAEIEQQSRQPVPYPIASNGGWRGDGTRPLAEEQLRPGATDRWSPEERAYYESDKFKRWYRANQARESIAKREKGKVPGAAQRSTYMINKRTKN